MHHPSGADSQSCLLPPDPASVRRARSLIVDHLRGADDEMVQTAVLLLSELVTNAVLHAKTEIEVRFWSTETGVHVRVSDYDNEHMLLPRRPDPAASTGRGLQLIESLAGAFGVERSTSGKTVWFELWPRGAAAGVAGTWPVVTPDLAAHLIQVTLLRLPVGLFRAAQRHRDSLLRECKLVALGDTALFGLPADALVRAESAHSVLTAGINAYLDAASDDQDVLDVRFNVPAESANWMGALAELLELANDAARAGAFLTRPALPEIRLFRMWLLGQVRDQISGAEPVPWADPDWPSTHRAQTRALKRAQPGSLPSDVATIVADDENWIIAANEAAAALLGWGLEELVGSRILAVIPRPWRQRHIVGFTNLLLTGESHMVGRPVDVPALHRNGTHIPVTLTLRVEQARDGNAQFVASIIPRD